MAINSKARHDLFQFTPLREGRRVELSIVVFLSNFNSRPSARGDALSVQHQKRQVNFNSRPSARGDGRCTTIAKRTGYFNSRPSARGDFPFFLRRHVASRFQFTPLREGRRGDGGHFRNRQDFNSRPSARGDLTIDYVSGIIPISIHAPPRGATRPCRGYKARTRAISIHAPPRGATVLRGERAETQMISIHAPPRGATRLV